MTGSSPLPFLPEASQADISTVYNPSDTNKNTKQIQYEFSDSDLVRAFTLFDLDHNSYVGSAELRHLFSVLNVDVTDSEIEEMLRLACGNDQNYEGQIDVHQFVKMMHKYTQRQVPKLIDDDSLKNLSNDANGTQSNDGQSNQSTTQSVPDAIPMTQTDSADAKLAENEGHITLLPENTNQTENATMASAGSTNTDQNELQFLPNVEDPRNQIAPATRGLSDNIVER